MGLRRVEHRPPHFAVVQFDMMTSDKYITDWIWENLEGRFYLGNEFVDPGTQSDARVTKSVAAFEIAAEASYFSLVLNTFNNPSVF